MADSKGKTGRVLRLNVLLEKEDDLYVAHCLELDVVATGETPEVAERNIIDLVDTHIDYAVENENWAYLFKPAPPDVFERFFKIKKAMCTILPLGMKKQTRLEIQELHSYA